MSNVIDLTADDAPPAAQPVVAVRGTGGSDDPLELDSDSDGEEGGGPSNGPISSRLRSLAAADQGACAVAWQEQIQINHATAVSAASAAATAAAPMVD